MREIRLSLMITVFLIATIILAVGMRGQISDKTYSVIDGKTYVRRSAFPAPAEPYYVVNSTSSTQGWFPSGEVRPNITEASGILHMIAAFSGSSRSTQAAVIQERLNISISDRPLFSISLSVPSDLKYGVRFWGRNANGAEVPVWWESSPFEHRTGKGREVLQIDLRSYSLEATGSLVGAITRIYLYMENPAMSGVSGVRSLLVDYISLSQLRLFDKPLGLVFRTYIVIVQDAPHFKDGDWKLERILLYAKVKATFDNPLTYLAYVTDLRDSLETTSRSYDYAIGAGGERSEIIQVNTFRASYLPTIYIASAGDLAIVFSAREGSFESIDVNSIQMVLTMQGLSWDVQPDPLQAELLTILVLGGAVITPLLAMTIIRFRYPKTVVSRRTIVVLLAAALGSRFFLAPFAGHAWDMEQWTQAARRYFESGEFSLQTFPTLPVYYYLLLGSYSWYAVLRVAGLPDFTLMFLPTRFFESIFIKAPLILSDGVSIISVFRLLRGRVGANKALLYSSLFAFNPLTIFVSAVWGMYDSVMVAFFLFGLEKLQRSDYVRSSVLLVLSALTKLLGIFPLLAVYVDLLLKGRVRKLMVSLLVSGIISFCGLYFEWGQFFYVTFLQRIAGVASVVRPLVGGLDNPFANPSQVFFVKAGLELPERMLYLLFGSIALYAAVIFLRGRKEDLVGTLIKSTLIALIGYYIFYIPVTVQHYSWFVPVLILYLSFRRSNIAGALPTTFGLVAVLLGVSSTVSFGYFVVGAPYIQVPPLEGSLHHIAVFGFVMMFILVMIPLWSLPVLRRLSSTSATLYVASFVLYALSASYLLIPIRLS